ncbi:MAG: hypothetical protein AAGH49_03135 [Pseudomonadota bacterium]
MRGTLLLMGLSVVLASPVQASEVKASIMEYKNEGAYTSRFFIRFELDNGKKCLVKPKGISAYTAPDGSLRYVLDDRMKVYTGPDNCLDKNMEIRQGQQVWGRILIDMGDSETCKKGKSVIFRRSGGTIKYKSKGTTKNNNRCRVTQWPNE